VFFFRIGFQIPSSVFTNDAMVLMANGFHTTVLQRETIQESVLDLLAFPNTVPVRGAPSQLQGHKFKQIYIHCSGVVPVRGVQSQLAWYIFATGHNSEQCSDRPPSFHHCPSSRSTVPVTKV
jgi:hypothetical protein